MEKKNKIINIEDFPKRNDGSIIWRECAGVEAKVIYEEKVYKMEIIDSFYDKDIKSYKLKIKIEGRSEIYNMHCVSFRKCMFRNILKSTFAMDTIPKAYRVDYEKNLLEFGYTKEYIDNLLSRTDVSLYFTCNECNKGIPKAISPRDLNKGAKVRNCNFCGDGFSYPEKVVAFVLDLLKVEYKTQLSRVNFQWCKDKFYDFYFKLNNDEYIIEAHGIQHYKETNRGRSLQEEQENDRIKREIALKNGILSDNYIELDCRKSNIMFIKQSILNSRLNELFDLNIIDWNELSFKAERSIMIKVCVEWENSSKGRSDFVALYEKYNLSDTSVRRYLKKGHSIGLCTYDGNSLIKERNAKSSELNKKNMYICKLGDKEVKLRSYSEICDYFNIDNRDTVRNIIKSEKPYRVFHKRFQEKYEHIIGLTIEKVV